MTVFVSYRPGAKGKFVTEICDLSIHPELVNVKKNKDISGGNVYWLTPTMQYHLAKNNL